MDKRLKILLEEVKGSDPNLDTMDRNTRVRAGNYQFPFSGQQLDYLLLTLAQDGSISKIEDEILPDVPYRVSIQDSSINGIVEEVLGSQILKASVLVIEGGSTGPISYLRCADSTSSVIQFASITKDLRLSVLSYDVSARNLTQAFVNINEEPEGIANSLYQYLGFTEEELTAEQFKNGLKNAILAYKDGPIA